MGGCCTPVVVGGPPPSGVYPPLEMPRAVGETSESEEAEPVLRTIGGKDMINKKK